MEYFKEFLGFLDKKKDIFSNSKVHIALLTILSIYLLFWGLGEGSLNPSDEARYAEVAKQIIKSDKWISLQFNHMDFFSKPPSYFWLTAVTYKIFGINEFSARFWSAAFGVGTVLAVYLLGKELFNKTTGFISALILLTTPQFNNYWSYSNTHSARAVAMETSVIFFIILSVLAFWMGRKQSKYLVLSGIFIGLGVMFKSAVGLIPLFIIFPFIIFSREFDIFKNKNLYKGVLGFFAVGMPWYALNLVTHGSTEFFRRYIMKNVVSRVTTGIGMPSVPDTAYIDVIKHGFYPWSIFILFAILYIAKDAFDKKKKENILLLCWISVVFLIFTHAHFKTAHYIMPIYPALSICTARFFDGFIKRKRDGLILGSMFIAFALWSSFITIIKYHPSGGTGFEFDIKDVDLIFGIAISAMVLFLYLTIGKLNEKYNKLKTALPLIIVGIIIASAIHQPVVTDNSYDIKTIAPVMKEISEPDAVLMLYKLPIKYTPTVFYSDRRVWNLPGGKEDKGYVIQYLNSSKTEFALTNLEYYEEIGRLTYKVLANYDDLILITNNNTIRSPQPVNIEKIIGGRIFFTDNNGAIHVKEFNHKKTSYHRILEFVPIFRKDSFDNRNDIANTNKVSIVNGSATLSKRLTEDVYESSGWLVSTTTNTKYPIVFVTPTWSATELDDKVNVTLTISVDNGTTWVEAVNGTPIIFTYNLTNKHLLYKAVFQTNDTGKAPKLRDITLTYEEQIHAKAEIVGDLKFSKNKLKRGEYARVNFTVKNTGDIVIKGHLELTDNKKMKIFTDYPKTSYKLPPGDIATFDHTFVVRRNAPIGKFRVWRGMREENLKTWLEATNGGGGGYILDLEIVK